MGLRYELKPQTKVYYYFFNANARRIFALNPGTPIASSKLTTELFIKENCLYIIIFTDRVVTLTDNVRNSPLDRVQIY